MFTTENEIIRRSWRQIQAIKISILAGFCYLDQLCRGPREGLRRHHCCRKQALPWHRQKHFIQILRLCVFLQSRKPSWHYVDTAQPPYPRFTPEICLINKLSSWKSLLLLVSASYLHCQTFLLYLLPVKVTRPTFLNRMKIHYIS